MLGQCTGLLPMLLLSVSLFLASSGEAGEEMFILVAHKFRAHCRRLLSSTCMWVCAFASNDPENSFESGTVDVATSLRCDSCLAA